MSINFSFSSFSYFLCFSFLFIAHIFETHAQAFDQEYPRALRFVEENKQLIKEQLALPPDEVAMVVACAFPELLRFEKYKNLAETSALELLYVRLGEKYADFSIGYFQIKPSFVEKLEKYFRQNKTKEFNFLTTYPSKDSTLIRQKRLERLQQLAWQLKYLKAFYTLVQAKFPSLEKLPSTEKVKFLASAYNLGFDAPEEKIKKWIGMQNFPYGSKYKGSQHAYTDLALEFYQKYGKSFFD